AARTGGRGPGHRPGAPGGHGDLHGACGGPGQGVRPRQTAGAELSGGALCSAPAGVRPSGRGAPEGPDAGERGSHPGGAGHRAVNHSRGRPRPVRRPSRKAWMA
ncbi:Thiamine transporter, partial [Dysosmobacter welbionis]